MRRMRRGAGNSRLSRYLAARRAAAGLSLEKLASLIGRATSTVNSWEQGTRTPSLEDMVVLARVFDTDVEELIHLAVPTAAEIQEELKKVQEAREAGGQQLKRRITFLRQFLAARKEAQRRRALEVLQPITTLKRVPLVGKVSAGPPKLALEETGEYTEVPEGVPVDYALVVRGDSMVGAGIDDGDIVWVRKQTVAKPGDTVVALLGREEVTVKHLLEQEGRWFLRANNPYRAYPDIPLGPEDEIIGVVERVIKKPGPPPLT
ncbi:MAG: Transcriptional regulator, XRE family [Moorella sp. 60_41]|nr:MAG: Transcriptional regulator, XRE family [Moorella sp. 60_41]